MEALIVSLGNEKLIGHAIWPQQGYLHDFLFITGPCFTKEVGASCKGYFKREPTVSRIVNSRRTVLWASDDSPLKGSFNDLSVKTKDPQQSRCSQANAEMVEFANIFWELCGSNS